MKGLCASCFALGLVLTVAQDETAVAQAKTGTETETSTSSTTVTHTNTTFTMTTTFTSTMTKSTRTLVDVQGTGGNFTVYDQRLGKAKGIQVAVYALREVDAGGNAVGVIGSIVKHSLRTFAQQDFTFEEEEEDVVLAEYHVSEPHVPEHDVLEHDVPEHDVPEHNVSEHNVSENNVSENNVSENNVSENHVPENHVSEPHRVLADRKSFSSTIFRLGQIKVDTYVIGNSGNLGPPGETWAVQKGDVKWNIELSNWTWCGCSPARIDETGAFIELDMFVKGLRRAEFKANNKSIDLGDGLKLEYSDQVLSDGNSTAMPAGYPKISTRGSSTYFTFRFPRFTNSSVYEAVLTGLDAYGGYIPPLDIDGAAGFGGSHVMMVAPAVVAITVMLTA